MKKTITAMFALLFILSVFTVNAQPELPDPGITPDSSLYFLDRMFDGFQSAESLADEKAAEMLAMAEIADEKAMEKAGQGYKKAMEKRQKEADEDEDTAEIVARQSSNHIAVLAQVREKVPEQARGALDSAINKSSKGRENALEALKDRNPERAESVGKATLEEVLAHAPEAAKKGLQRALEAQGNNSIHPGQSGEAKKDAPEDKGEASDENRQDMGEENSNASEQTPAENKKKETAETEDMAENPDNSPEKARTDSGEDNFRMLVSDAPADIADFDYLEVQLEKTRIFSGDGFEEREIDVTVDLTQLVGEISTEVLETELEPGVYNKIELYVSSVDANVNNESADVMVPSEKLQITKSFEIVSGNVTTFVFDINVVRKGRGDAYNLLPVISESGVVGKDLDEDKVEERDRNETEEIECQIDEDCEAGFECVNSECEEIETAENETEDSNISDLVNN